MDMSRTGMAARRRDVRQGTLAPGPLRGVHPPPNAYARKPPLRRMKSRRAGSREQRIRR